MKISSRYLSRNHLSPNLTRAQELALARRAARGHKDATRLLVMSNLRFVAMVAAEYRNCGLPLEDLMSEGCLGLIRAIPRFEPERGLRLFSYASFWVRKAMLRALAYQVPLVPISAYRRAKEKHDPESNRTALPLRGVPIDETPDNGRTPLIEQMIDEATDSPETAIIRREAIIRLRRAMVHLSPRDRHVVEMRFGFSGSEGSTLQEVSTRLGVSRERVRQIEMRARSVLKRELDRISRERSVA